MGTNDGDQLPFAADELFQDEDDEVRALLQRVQAAQLAADHLAVLDLTEQLLARQLHSSGDVVHLLRGDAFIAQADPAQAAEHYRLAIAHGADDASVAWFKLGNALAAGGNTADAALALSRAGELEPDHPAIWLQLGYALLDEGDFVTAATAFGIAVELTNGAKGHYGLAWLSFARARESVCTEERLVDTSIGLQELRLAIEQGELGPEPGQVGAVQAMLLGDLVEPDFPFWHCWVNPAFELARGTDLLLPPANTAWAELVRWPRDAQGRLRILRDVLIELPEWG